MAWGPRQGVEQTQSVVSRTKASRGMGPGPKPNHKLVIDQDWVDTQLCNKDSNVKGNTDPSSTDPPQNA